MRGKAAVVTGGARGIGFAVARRLLLDGVNVVVADLRGDATDHMKLVAQKVGARFVPVVADVTQYTQVQDVGGRALSEFGRLDIWVNNAGWDRIVPFLSTSPDDWDRLIDVNLKSVIYGTRVGLEAMVDRKAEGAVVNIGSDAGRVGSSGEAVYSAAKGGVIAFTKAVAREVARHGVRVNCVCPGPTETPLLAEIFGSAEGAKVIESIKRGIPFRRLGTPEEVAAAVRFLASPEASYITGQVLSVNGGLTMAG
jgi:2-hydroxycyclohexanecarboxyl-CoA dehydrogenase